MRILVDYHFLSPGFFGFITPPSLDCKALHSDSQNDSLSLGLRESAREMLLSHWQLKKRDMDFPLSPFGVKGSSLMATKPTCSR